MTAAVLGACAQPDNEKADWGLGHGFYGQQQTQAIDWMLDFLNAEEQKAATEDEPQDDGADANVISARENVKK